MSDERILRLPAVCECVGLGRSTLYRMMDRGEFPRPVKLGAKANGWRKSDVQAWIAARSEAP